MDPCLAVCKIIKMKQCTCIHIMLLYRTKTESVPDSVYISQSDCIIVWHTWELPPARPHILLYIRVMYRVSPTNPQDNLQCPILKTTMEMSIVSGSSGSAFHWDSRKKRIADNFPNAGLLFCQPIRLTEQLSAPVAQPCCAGFTINANELGLMQIWCCRAELLLMLSLSVCV